MLLKVTHRTEYNYDQPVRYGLQRLRLVPRDGATQKVGKWSVTTEGAREELGFVDQFANETRLISVEGEPKKIAVTATGSVETFDKAGVTGPHSGFAPLWLFAAETPLTAAGGKIADLAAEAGRTADSIERLHDLMGLIGERVDYVPGATSSATTAEDALAQGGGVCQDHSHIFISCARRLGHPARYVSGYLMMDGVAEQVASHAWAEVHVDNLGWVAFDVANGVSPDERYVRLAVGRDYRDAMPVSGIMLGQVRERLAVHITVEQ
jgi:transglutaminase-like putative cysteine protease